MPKAHYSVSIVIPVWNQWAMTETCLRSIREHTLGDNFQVVLADNGSTDETPTRGPALGRALFGEHFVHARLHQNLGFAKACNEGAWKSAAEYLLFLNNDTEVTDAWLDPLVAAMRADSRLAGVGPLLLFPDDGTVRAGRVQHLGIATAHEMEFRHLYEYFPHTHPAVTRRRRLNVVTAAALLMPARLFKAENGFFTGFVNGMEDVDLCCRIAARGGYFSVIPESVVFHHTHGTEGRFDREADNLRLLRKRCRHAKADIYDLIQDDGYEPGFTEWLDLTIRPPKERTRELEERFGQDPTVEHLYALIEQEPLWDHGYAWLAGLLENEGELNEAMPVAYFRSLLCPSLESYEECVRVVRACGLNDMADRYSLLLRNLRAAMQDQATLTRKARHIYRTVAIPSVRNALTGFLPEDA